MRLLTEDSASSRSAGARRGMRLRYRRGSASGRFVRWGSDFGESRGGGIGNRRCRDRHRYDHRCNGDRAGRCEGAQRGHAHIRRSARRSSVASIGPALAVIGRVLHRAGCLVGSAMERARAGQRRQGGRDADQDDQKGFAEHAKWQSKGLSGLWQGAGARTGPASRDARKSVIALDRTLTTTP